MKTFCATMALYIGVQLFWVLAFYFNCETYLRRTSNASTVETAKTELDTALGFMERNNMTSGYTILPLAPFDIEFWYNNIKQARLDLDNVDMSSTLSKSNSLIKLREVLLDGDDITKPFMISYGNVAMWAMLVNFGMVIAFFVISYKFRGFI